MVVKGSKTLVVDAFINLLLGFLLLIFPIEIVQCIGIPEIESAFYPNLLGAVLIGIAIALLIEYARKPHGPAGLGLYGAVAINVCGALVLGFWLVSGRLQISLRGHIMLWILVLALLVISSVELVVQRKESLLFKNGQR
jgi:hypothetical protein